MIERGLLYRVNSMDYVRLVSLFAVYPKPVIGEQYLEIDDTATRHLLLVE